VISEPHKAATTHNTTEQSPSSETSSSTSSINYPYSWNSKIECRIHKRWPMVLIL